MQGLARWRDWCGAVCSKSNGRNSSATTMVGVITDWSPSLLYPTWASSNQKEPCDQRRDAWRVPSWSESWHSYRVTGGFVLFSLTINILYKRVIRLILSWMITLALVSAETRDKSKLISNSEVQSANRRALQAISLTFSDMLHCWVATDFQSSHWSISLKSLKRRGVGIAHRWSR